MYDIAVIGAGPAGLTAAVYALRADRSVLVLEKAAFGGQITWSPKVENFPGVISASGNEIADLLVSQAMEQGAEVELEEITGIDFFPNLDDAVEDAVEGQLRIREWGLSR